MRHRADSVASSDRFAEVSRPIASVTGLARQPAMTVERKVQQPVTSIVSCCDVQASPPARAWTTCWATELRRASVMTMRSVVVNEDWIEVELAELPKFREVRTVLSPASTRAQRLGHPRRARLALHRVRAVGPMRLGHQRGRVC